MPPRRRLAKPAPAGPVPAQPAAPAAGADELRAVFRRLRSDADRRAALAVCRAWHAAFAADPSLWPAVVLRGMKGLRAADREVAKFAIRSGLQADTNAAAAVVSAAAAVSRRAQRVKMERFEARPELVIACLAVLPPGLKHLELATRCTGPLPAALDHFRELSTLVITGDGSEAD
ncbi:hypothetical protein ABPG75_010848 [Micractinium tetrahymenae]